MFPLRLLPRSSKFAALCSSTALAVAIVGCGPKYDEPGSSAKVETPVVVINRPVVPAPGTAENPFRASGNEPELSKVVIRDKREWTLPESAARSLGKIGSAAVPELTKDLNNTDPEVRQRAADVLARIGPAAKQAVPDLVAALEDDDEAVRKSAALALGQIGPAAADAVPALMRVMKEPGKVPEAGGSQR